MKSTPQLVHLTYHEHASPSWCMYTPCMLLCSETADHVQMVYCHVCRGARQQLQQDGTLHVQKSLKKSVDSIMRLSMHLDMLVLQINVNSKYASHYFFHIIPSTLLRLCITLTFDWCQLMHCKVLWRAAFVATHASVFSNLTAGQLQVICAIAPVAACIIPA